MRTENGTLSRSRTIVFLLLVSLFIVSSIIILSGFWISSPDYEHVSLASGWTVTLNGEELPGDNIEEILTSFPEKGDELVCETRLPEMSAPFVTLRLYAMHALIDCQVGDTPVYSYGTSFFSRHRFLPQGYHLIPLPDHYAGKILTLRLTAGERHAFSTLRAPQIGNVRDLLSLWVREKRAVILVGVFLTVFGFLISFLTLSLRYYRSDYHMVSGGLVSMNIGMFALCYFDAFFFVTKDLGVSTYIEYFMQMLLPVTISLFLRGLTDDRAEKKLVSVLFGISAAAAVLMVILQMSQVCPLSLSMIHFQRFAFLVGVVLVGIAVRVLLRNRLQIRNLRASAVPSSSLIDLFSNVILLIAILVLIFSVLFDLGAYHVTRYFLRLGDSAYSHVPLLLGMASYAVLTMISFFCQGVSSTYENNLRQGLRLLAYTDALTGLPNRAYCNRVFEALDQETGDFCILALDVDYLKQTNDLHGHAAGDELLRNFADELRASFRASDVIGRMGGDEFLAVLRNISLQECLSKAAQLEQKLHFGFSYGCAHNREFDTRSAADVYRRADERMYRMKEERHQTDV